MTTTTLLDRAREALRSIHDAAAQHPLYQGDMPADDTERQALLDQEGGDAAFVTDIAWQAAMVLADLDRARVDNWWLPIETAPKDGSMFLAWVFAEQYGEDDDGNQLVHDMSFCDFCQWRTGTDPVPYGWFDHMAARTYDVEEVTHWRPLPAPPIATESAEKA